MNHLICETPSGNIAILLNLGVVERLHDVIQKSADREIGGVLWGHRDRQSGISGRRIIIIDDFEPVKSENFDRSVLAGPRATEGNVPVGFFRSHLRQGMDLDEADFSLFREYFSGNDDVFLLARPEASGAPMAGFFVWEDGKLERRSNCADFPLDRGTLEAGGYPLLRGAVAPAEIPAFVPKPVRRTTFPKPLNRRAKRVAYATIGAMLILGTLIWAAVLHFPSQREDTSAISLSIERTGNALRLSWDPNASAVEHANSGILWISDGDKKHGLELNSARLKAGNYMYTPVSSSVSFRLDILKVLAQGSESVRYVNEKESTVTAAASPSLKPSPTAPRTSPAVPTPVEAATPRQAPPRAEPVVSVTTQPLPSSRVRTWMAKVPLVRGWQRNRYRGGDGFVPPRTLREVLPHVPARLAHELPRESRVDLKVTVDANGTVREIDLLSTGGDERLARIAADALRQWRFEPARVRDKRVPCDLLATLSFRNPPPGGLVAQRE